MCEGCEQFIFDAEEELRRIRNRELEELLAAKGMRQEMSLKPMLVTDSDFDEAVAGGSLTLIDCWAAWCGPCAAIAPAIEELAREYAGRVQVGKLNVDENPKAVERLQVFSIPALVMFKDGREIDRIVGLVPKDQIRQCLTNHLR